MKLLTLPLVALALGSNAPPPEIGRAQSPLAPQRDCPEPEPYLARGEKLVPQRLADLPPARMERAVAYHEDGCPVPVIVRQQVGG